MNVKEAKKISIIDYLGALGHHPAYTKYGQLWYCSPIRVGDRHPSFSVNQQKNVWHDFGTGEGGTIIDLAMKICRCAVAEALQNINVVMHGVLLGSLRVQPSNSFSEPIVSTEPERAKKEEMDVEVRELKHPALLQYIRERGIPDEISVKECKEVHYMQYGRKFFAVGFPTSSGGWEVRSRLESSKRSLGKKNYTHICHQQRSVVVFEGFIDYLSFFAALPPARRSHHDYLILNSIAMIGKSLPVMDTYDKVLLCLDNDEAGMNAAKDLESRLKGKVTNLSPRYAPHKDVNDWWLATNKKTKI